MALSDAERSQFDEDGYVVKRGVVPPADLGPIREALSDVIGAQVERLAREGAIGETFADAPFERRLALVCERYPERLWDVMGPIFSGRFTGPEIFHSLTHPALLSCVESLVGPTIIGSSVYRVRPKLPNWDRGEVPWHQDSGYFLAHCDDMLVLTCWIPLIDVDEDNGCLFVIPGSHRDGITRHYTGGHGGYLEIAEEDLPAGERVAVPMRQGDVLFLANLTAHASFANRTPDVRWSLDLRYQNGAVPNNIGEEPADYTPERDPVTMACHPPEADFVIRDPECPEREVRDASVFHDMRERFFAGRAYHPGRGWTPLHERRR